MNNPDQSNDMRVFVNNVLTPHWIGPVTFAPAGSGKPGITHLYFKFGLQEKEDNMTLEIIGPFGEGQYKFVLDGYQVPYLTAAKIGETELSWSGNWNVVLDDRFTVIMNTEQIESYIWLIANAMAVAGGYTSHGPGSVPRNLFGPSSPRQRVNYYAPPSSVKLDTDTLTRLLREMDEKQKAIQKQEDDFQHFLSYSGMSVESPEVINKMRKAFLAAIDSK